MNNAQVIQIATDLLFTTVILSLPAVAASLLVGLFISVLQTMTSIQEQTLTFAPRIIAVAVVLVATMPWALRTASSFTLRVMANFVEAGQQ